MSETSEPRPYCFSYNELYDLYDGLDEGIYALENSMAIDEQHKAIGLRKAQKLVLKRLYGED